jgi:hypothetical protein
VDLSAQPACPLKCEEPGNGSAPEPSFGTRAGTAQSTVTTDSDRPLNSLAAFSARSAPMQDRAALMIRANADDLHHETHRDLPRAIRSSSIGRSTTCTART